MADRKDLDFTYSLIDRIFRLSLGELADFSGAKFDGDFSLSLEQAQRRKHDYVAEQVGIGPGRRVLDLGCGWGPLLAVSTPRGGPCTGAGPAAAPDQARRPPQAEACRRHGREVHGRDARTVTRETFGPFDAVGSLGAWEHFCSPEEHAAGRQDEIYRGVFENVAGLLPPGGRFYLQTMVFGPNAVRPEAATLDAPRGSDTWVIALLGKQFPGSFLPFGSEQVVENAAPYFRLVERQSGRLDYIETIKQWRRRFAEPSLQKYLLKARLVPIWLTSPDFRLAFTSGVSANSITFERELLEHYRLVFEKPGSGA